MGAAGYPHSVSVSPCTVKGALPLAAVIDQHEACLSGNIFDEDWGRLVDKRFLALIAL